MGERDFSALFQQNPIPDTGTYFKAEWLLPVDRLPPLDSLRVYGGSDYAVTADGGDYTVHAVLVLDPDDNPWLLDVWRRQAASDEWVEAFCDLVVKWKPMAWAEESGQIKSGVGPWLEREMRARRAYVAREQFPTRGDKAIRAQSFRGLIATRGLRVPALAPWRADFENELLRFPAGVHDDIVDSLGLVGQLLDVMIAGQRPKPPETRVIDGYRDSETSYSEHLGARPGRGCAQSSKSGRLRVSVGARAPEGVTGAGAFPLPIAPIGPRDGKGGPSGVQPNRKTALPRTGLKDSPRTQRPNAGEGSIRGRIQ